MTHQEFLQQLIDKKLLAIEMAHEDIAAYREVIGILTILDRQMAEAEQAEAEAEATMMWLEALAEGEANNLDQVIEITALQREGGF